MDESGRPLWHLFGQLRRRGFPLSPADYEGLRRALRAGFGWSGRSALRDLCAALWAKARREQEVVKALFDQLDLPDWQLPAAGSAPVAAPGPPATPDEVPRDEPAGTTENAPPPEPGPAEEVPPATRARGELPPVSLRGAQPAARPFVFVPDFPLTYREAAQAWRRLRRPTRSGPPVELDVGATVDRWGRRGVRAEVVLVPRRVNAARLLLLVDRNGSMAPFHRFVQEVSAALTETGRLRRAAVYYFHDVPAEGADVGVLAPLAGQLFPVLDPVLGAIEPLTEGQVYRDAALLDAVPLREVLRKEAAASVVVVSDGGAARGRFDALRLLDTAAFLKGVGASGGRCVWLNPLPARYWGHTASGRPSGTGPTNTCTRLARHVPMFALDREGIHHAVNVLRGQVYHVERPL
jgi:uncharacterized protein